MKPFVVRLLFLIFLPSFCFSQADEKPWKIYLEAAVNYPLFNSPETSVKSSLPFGTGYTVYYYNVNLREKYSSYPGGKLGAEVQRSLGRNFYAGAGMNLELIRFSRTMEYGSPTSLNDSIHILVRYGVPVGYYYAGFDSVIYNVSGTLGTLHSNEIGRTAILYLDIPVYAGFQVLHSRFSLSLGLTTGLLAWSKQHKVEAAYMAYNLNREYVDTSSDGLMNLRFTGNAGIQYAFTERIHGYLSYAFPLSPVYDKAYQYAGKARGHVLEMGVKVGVR